MSSTAPAIAAPAASSLPPLLERLRAQPKLPMIIGAAALVTAAAAFTLMNRGPDYKVLYTNVSDRDGGAIIASLQQMNVPYKFAEGGGAILIAGDKVPEVRLKLAAQGLPKAGGVGFELMDNQKFGTSQFAEQVNYQRALEGELARSIESVGTVRIGAGPSRAAQALAVRARAEEALGVGGADPASRPQHRRGPGQRDRAHDLQQRAGTRPAKSVTVVDQAATCCRRPTAAPAAWTRASSSTCRRSSRATSAASRPSCSRSSAPATCAPRSRPTSTSR